MKEEAYNIVQVNHFVVTHLLVILVAIPITLAVSFQNKFYHYFLYCFPVFCIFLSLQYVFIWKRNKENTKIFNCLSCVGLFVSLPIFFGLYFGFYYETTSMQFQKIENCRVTGKMSTNIEKNENYSMLYVDFEYKGQVLLGQACSSNQLRAPITEGLNPSTFYKYGDSVPCNEYKNMTEYRNKYQDKAAEDEEDSTDVTVSDGDSDNSSGLYSKHQNLGKCSFPYLFSKVKIPSWFCIDRSINIEEFMEPRTCYMNLYQYDELALKNGINREYMRRVYHFPLITFQNPNYYPIADIICLIIFTYYPFLISLNVIFKTIAEYLIFFIQEIIIERYNKSFDNKQVSLQNVSIQ